MARAGKAKAGNPGSSIRHEVPKKKSNEVSDLSGPLKLNILDLGGDEQDFEFLQEVDIDQDLPEAIGSTDKSLKKELKQFMHELGLGRKEPEIVESISEDELEDKDDERDTSPVDDNEEDVVPVPEPQSSQVTAAAFKTQGRYIVPPASHWYTTLEPLPVTSLPAASPEYSAAQLAKAKQLHEEETDKYAKADGGLGGGGSKSDSKFLARVLTSGTVGDKLSALTLMAQAAPLYNTRALSSLLSICQKKNREESLKGLRALTDWWVGGGAPDRKLKYFQEQPLTHPSVTDAHRIVWYFEDWLKKLFWDILQNLERLSLDPLSYVRTQATAFVYILLAAKPEQEQNLLRLLVNKLGDSEKQLASKTSFHILQILQQHPNMKAIVVSEISSLLLRAPLSTSAAIPKDEKQALIESSKKLKAKGSSIKDSDKAGINPHARYYATITFNQMILSSSDRDQVVASKLVSIYFEMFKQLLGLSDEKEEEGSKPNDDDEKTERVKGRSEMRKDKAKRLEKKGPQGQPKPGGAFAEVEDGNEKFVSAILTGLHRALPFAARDTAFFDKHINTLFHLTHSSTFNISIQSLLLINSVIVILAGQLENKQVAHAVTTQRVQSRYYRTLYASLLDPRLATSSKQALYLNLLLKSLKADVNVERVKAFVRRLIALLVGGGVAGDTAFLCGALYLLGEIASAHNELRQMFRVTPKETEDAFDPRKREPEFAGADRSAVWELAPLLHHYHPSVALHAKQLLEGRTLTASADLSLNTLTHFLDRFVYRNPKKPSTRGTSAMQPVLGEGGSVGNHRVVQGTGAATEDVMNEDAFRKRKEGNVPPDQVFFHKFFLKKHQQQSERNAKSAKRKTKGDDDVFTDEEGAADSDAASDAVQEAEIWKAMKSTMPRAGGDDADLDDMSDDLSTGSQASDVDVSEDESKPGRDDDMEFLEDDDDILASDAEVPGGLIPYESESSDEGSSQQGEWDGLGGSKSGKRKGAVDQKSGKGAKRRKLKHLPTFASYEEYEKMIDEAPEDNI